MDGLEKSKAWRSDSGGRPEKGRRATRTTNMPPELSPTNTDSYFRAHLPTRTRASLSPLYFVESLFEKPVDCISQKKEKVGIAILTVTHPPGTATPTPAKSMLKHSDTLLLARC